MTPQSDVALAPYCTMQVGGPARWFADARSQSDVCAALTWAERHNVAVFVLGGGSNVVIADEGLDGLVLRVSIRGIDTSHTPGGVSYVVGAGEPWDAFVQTTVDANVAGVECLSGIPGFAGGTPVQNVGAYGQEVSTTIRHVAVVDRRTKEALSWSNEECEFRYRNSRFKSVDINRFIVTRVEFGLVPDGTPTIAYADVLRYFEDHSHPGPSLSDVRNAILTIRRRKGMVIESDNRANRSCGSFFVNPVVTRADYERVRALVAGEVPHYRVDDSHVKIPAAWLIERAGFPKGTTCGAVGISPFQAQAIINLGGARAADVLALATEIKRGVLNQFGVCLVPEPVFLGFASSSLSWLLDPYVDSSH